MKKWPAAEPLCEMWNVKMSLSLVPPFDCYALKTKNKNKKKHQQISIQRFQASEGKEGMEGIGGIEFFT